MQKKVPAIRQTCLAFFSNNILTMKFKVKGNMGLKPKDTSIKLKYISNEILSLQFYKLHVWAMEGSKWKWLHCHYIMVRNSHCEMAPPPLCVKCEGPLGRRRVSVKGIFSDSVLVTHFYGMNQKILYTCKQEKLTSKISVYSNFTSMIMCIGIAP